MLIYNKSSNTKLFQKDLNVSSIAIDLLKWCNGIQITYQIVFIKSYLSNLEFSSCLFFAWVMRPNWFVFFFFSYFTILHPYLINWFILNNILSCETVRNPRKEKLYSCFKVLFQFSNLLHNYVSDDDYDFCWTNLFSDWT